MGIFRWIVNSGSYLIERLATRTQVVGVAQLDQAGPVIYAANHASTFDALLYFNHLPKDTILVGPGDFELLWPADFFVKRLHLILVDRGSVDRESLAKMTMALKSHHRLALFPEGGTWEKRLDDVKTGASYLSHLANVPIIPISISGTYRVWYKIARLQRPRVRVVVGKPLPPVQLENRKQRQEVLRSASHELMQRIYEGLESADQARYNIVPYQRFSAQLELSPQVNLDCWQPQDLTVLTELISKPNLFSPLLYNAKLPLTPLAKHSRFYPAHEFQVAAKALLNALKGNLSRYISYRLGEYKSQIILTELDYLSAIAKEGATKSIRIRFIPKVTIADEPAPPNL